MVQAELMDIGAIRENPDNPRTVSDEKLAALVRSVKDFPEMLNLRPIVVDDSGMVLGGNMRLRACEEAGITRIPVLRASQLTEDQKREFIIKDNVGSGTWDWGVLASEWDTETLVDWGLPADLYNESPDEYGDSFSLPDGEKCPFVQMTFTLANEQAEVVRRAIHSVRDELPESVAEMFGNENGNGNALYLMSCAWDERRK